MCILLDPRSQVPWFVTLPCHGIIEVKNALPHNLEHAEPEADTQRNAHLQLHACQVEGTTKEQRCKRKLSDALRVMKLHIELNKVQMKDEMAGMLLSDLVNSNSLIRPADWQSKAMAVCQNYFQDRLIHPKKVRPQTNSESASCPG